jgi:hypothetical protein
MAYEPAIWTRKNCCKYPASVTENIAAGRYVYDLVLDSGGEVTQNT